ncbi:MAG: FAD-linked oxidase C-terminal domain-containing protein [Betaproteobacteria bacterium]
MQSIQLIPAPTKSSRTAHPLEEKLRGQVDGEVLFDAASRGRYATDASIYQVMPVGVVVPRTMDAAISAMQIAAEQGVAILPRGGGTSQCGQTVGAALVIDNSKFLNQLLETDAENRRAVVQPGMVLDHLNAKLKSTGLWFPVDVSTSAQATIGGMAGNNSCGSRSIEYGNMVHNVAGIEAVLADGAIEKFGELVEGAEQGRSQRYRDILAGVRAICEREKNEIAARFPPLLRRVAGYNLDIFAPRDPLHYNSPMPNLAHLLVGSEGTLAYFKSLELKLSPLPKSKVLGVVNFPTFYQAMELTQHIVKLGPTAVELVDRTMIDLARNNPAFRPVIDAALIGEPEAILLVEFAGEDQSAQQKKLDDLAVLMDDLGLPESVVKMTQAGAQKSLWEVRKAGLNIMMSMKGDGKPVSFIEDCCVPLEHLAEYTRRLTEVFEKHGTRGTWYAHASVGTLHVRPILDMRRDGAGKMRAIAEEAAALVKEYKGVYSGEHGDGLVRSEWIAPFFGPRLTGALGEIKSLFDPKGLMNPGKIVNPSKQDDRSLFRFKPGYEVLKLNTVMDWREFGQGVDATASGGLGAAVEMCNNNGHCRKFDAGTMCPSYRATGDEQHLTRGRANTLRLALSGQLGPDGFTSDDVKESMELCVGCKGCKRECPTGVDMAKMKIEFTHHYKQRHGHTLRDKFVAYLPRYAPHAWAFGWLLNLRNFVPGAAWLSEKTLGFSARRKLPLWRRPLLSSIGAARWQKAMRKAKAEKSETYFGPERDVVLWVDTFTNYFEGPSKDFPGISAEAASIVLHKAGYNVDLIGGATGERPLCCGRTFLATGMVEEAKKEARRTIAALRPYIDRGVPIIGLEPSCLLTLRDEFKSMLPGEETDALASRAFLFEEFLVAEKNAGRFDPARLEMKPIKAKEALLHGHCHQKAFGAMSAVEEVLSWVPELKTTTVESSCCGMAGAFGYEAAHFDVSMAMGELSLLPAVRKAGADTIIVADGTSCRHQIADGAQREAVPVAVVLAQAVVSLVAVRK